MPRVHQVTDPQLAKALTSTVGVHYLSPFFDRERSVQQACDYLDEPMGRVHHWVRRWTSLGALEVVGRRERPGRPIALYRTVADEFHVPEALLPLSLLARQLAAANKALLRGLEAAVPHIVFGGTLKIYQEDGQRGTTVDRSSSDSEGAARNNGAMHMSSTMLLTRQEAYELYDDLVALRDRWLERTRGRSLSDRSNGLQEQLVVLATVPEAPAIT